MEKHIFLVLFDVVADICVSTTSVECSALQDLLMAQKRTDKLYERATEVFLSKENGVYFQMSRRCCCAATKRSGLDKPKLIAYFWWTY